MTSIILRWVLNALALLLVGYLVPGVTVSGFMTALVLVVVFGIINVTIKPLLVLLTLPINILTLGLFTLIINALLFWFVATFIKGFAVENFLAAFLGTLLYSVITTLVSHYAKAD
ncbi:MAG: phage holin family protein [Candidatus Paceibacterota bacterium]|jgi:putative membrane protein